MSNKIQTKAILFDFGRFDPESEHGLYNDRLVAAYSLCQLEQGF